MNRQKINTFVSAKELNLNTVLKHVVTGAIIQVILKNNIKTFKIYLSDFNKFFYTNAIFMTDRHIDITEEIANTTNAYIHPVVQ